MVQLSKSWRNVAAKPRGQRALHEPRGFAFLRKRSLHVFQKQMFAVTSERSNASPMSSHGYKQHNVVTVGALRPVG